MITIDENTLLELGIDLGNLAPEFLKKLEKQLDERIAAAVLELLDDEQAKEYIALSKTENAAAVQNWLAEHVPEYKEVIQDEVDLLLGEVASSKIVTD